MGDVGWHWMVFGGSMALLLAIDLFTHRRGRQSSTKAAACWSVIWISAGIAFSVVVHLMGGSTEEYLAAYAMEKSLSLDNMFVFLLIFASLNIPDRHQHTALAWGIFGALVFRGIFIAVGLSALERWEWIRYVFGGILLFASYHSLREDPNQTKDSRVVLWLSQHLPVSKDAKANRFLVKEKGTFLATPLLVALVAIELSDVAFAIDSVPAALSVSRDRFIVYSSNAYAILGLRSLYLATHSLMSRLVYLHYGLAAVLAFAAFKLVLGEAFEIAPLLSVAIIASCIVVAALASLRAPAPEAG